MIIPPSRSAVTRAILLVMALSVCVFMFSSCRSRSTGGAALGAEADRDSTAPAEGAAAHMDSSAPVDTASGGVRVTAYLITDRKEIEERFGMFLPDSGIVPLEVTLHNETDRPLVIHTSHGLAAPEPFHGLTLAAGGSEYIPVEPLDVLAVLLGKRGEIRYRRPGIFDAVIGIAVPPALFYYGYRELTVGRRYRSIFKHSIYEGTKGGAVRPLRMEGGEEIKGCLFFYLTPDLNPYTAGDGEACVDSSRAASLDLTVRPCAERSFDTLSGVDEWNDAAVAYPPAAESAEARRRGAVVFALPAGGKWRGGGLLAGRVEEVLRRGGDAMNEVSGAVSSSARIAGTAAAGAHAACAINFKATSSVYVVDLSGTPALLGEIDLDRKIERIFLTGDVLIVATSDGRCRYVPLDGMKERRDVKIGRHLRDLVLDGDRLLVMEEKELSLYSAAPRDPLALYERRPLEKADRRFAGVRDGMIYVLHGAGDAGRDTLAVYHNGSFLELARLVLPAGARFADVGIRDIHLQLDGGLLLRVLFHGTTREFETEVIGHLPFDAALVERTEGGYTVLGRDGSLAAGDIIPSLLSDLVTAVPVVPKPPEVTPRRSRAGR